MTKKEVQIEKGKKLWELYGQTNRLDILSKWILTQPAFRQAQVRELKITFSDGVTFDLDSRKNKAYLKFIKSLKP